MTLPNLQYAATPICRGYSAVESYTYTIYPATKFTGGSTTPAAYRDMNVLQTTGTTTDSVFKISLAGGYAPTVTNLTPAVATVSANDGPAVWVSNGIAQLRIDDPVYGSSLLTAPVTRTVSSTANNFNGYMSTSLAYALKQPVDALISAEGGPPTSVSADVFVSNDLHSSCTRAANLWCLSIVDLSAIPIGRYTAGGYTTQFNGCLIADGLGANSSRHMIAAQHVALSVGDTLYFMNSGGGAIQSATVLQSANVPGTDINIAYLSAAITVATPFQVFPANTWAASGACALPLATDAMPNSTLVPLIHFNQNQECLLLDLVAWGSASSELMYYPTTNPLLAGWSTSPSSGKTGPYSGDSGSPVFTALPGSIVPILLGTCHTTGSCPNPATNIAGITTIMQSTAAAQGDGFAYTPVVANISSYPTY